MRIHAEVGRVRPGTMVVHHARDEDLVRRLTQRDAEALAQLYDRYSRALFALSLRMLADREAAEELVQDVFLRLWRQPASYDPARGAFLPWLLSVAHHRAVDELRRRRPSTPLDDVIAAVPSSEAAADPLEQAWLSERRRAVRAALTQLPAEQRTALELAYFGGLTQREVAEQTGEPLGTIKTRMRLGLMKLRDALTRAGQLSTE